MLNSSLIGHLGADAECKNSNGNEFITFRVANTDKWTDEAGQVHETTTWVDCVMSGKPKVFEFLKKGQQVFVSGSVTLRVYSSAKEKKMKAGLTINVKQLELIGGKADEVPSLLYSEDGQTEHRVGKFFYAPSARDTSGDMHNTILLSRSGERYIADPEGWVKKEITSVE